MSFIVNYVVDQQSLETFVAPVKMNDLFWQGFLIGCLCVTSLIVLYLMALNLIEASWNRSKT